jgi:membrane protein implicated in regulation of membrane protease activity
MFETIAAYWLLAFGILFIGLEALTFTFVLFFLGIGFIFVSAISLFYAFDNGVIQIAAAFVLALVFAIILRKTLLKKLSKPNLDKEERAHVSGVGIIEDGVVKFDGTYWKTLDDISGYKNGDTVAIKDVKDNMVILEKS